MASKYSVGELVWAADKNFSGVYLSKIIKIQTIADVTKYFIHFQKWARKFDIWVDEDCLAQQNDLTSKEKLHKMLGSSVGDPTAQRKTKGAEKGSRMISKTKLNRM